MKQPISIEELMAKKKALKKDQARPKYISKKDREALQKTNVSTNGNNTTARSNGSNGNSVTKVFVESEKRKREDNLPPLKKKRTDRFRFEWKKTDDTLERDDYLYAAAAAVTSEAAPQKERDEIKDVHWSQKPLGEMTKRDWRIFKEDFEIVTKGATDLPSPLRTWSESDIPKRILRIVDAQGYKDPTPIQRAAIPIALSKRDVIGIAETGSGKTASFIIPLLSSIIDKPMTTEGPYALILAPTRELAQQIEAETKKFCEPLGFRCISIVGGHRIEVQINKLDAQCEIVIATPGRLLDCIDRRIVVLGQCKYVVLDEADRMIDFGFEEQVQKILDYLPPGEHAQTMMFTATWPRAIEKMAANYLQNPGTITIGSQGQATDQVEQLVEFVTGEEKRKKRLVEIVSRRQYSPPVIVFVNIKKTSEAVAKALNDAGFKAVTMHGSKSQEQREQSLSQLRSGAAQVLVATDVAGRGIDVPNVSLVVNFQMAKSIEDYTHRIGRTGRAGKKGTAITFLDMEEDEKVLIDLKRVISRSRVSKVPIELKRLK
ncbi:pre-mRNA-splicing ATP-dependent RNA helicase Prp28p [Trichomonascus vanleenenianus]|uniref:mRNA splicing protein PRP28 n=1 Tax=Trichomonascus vanleenenianus TaxID=2268995 RepID=UPI003ECB00C7